MHLGEPKFLILIFYLLIFIFQLIPLSGDAFEIEVEQNFLQKKLIAISAYFGELIHVEDDQ